MALKHSQSSLGCLNSMVELCWANGSQLTVCHSNWSHRSFCQNNNMRYECAFIIIVIIVCFLENCKDTFRWSHKKYCHLAPSQTRSFMSVFVAKFKLNIPWKLKRCKMLMILVKKISEITKITSRVHFLTVVWS